MLLPDRRQVCTRTLLRTLFGWRNTLSLGTRNFARSHCFGATAGMVVDAVNGTRKLKGSLLQQRSKPLVRMIPINER